MSQFEILLDMQSKGFNAVSCGQCGDIFLHKTKVDELTCPHCAFEDDISSFPDIFTGDYDCRMEIKPLHYVGGNKWRCYIAINGCIGF